MVESNFIYKHMLVKKKKKKKNRIFLQNYPISMIMTDNTRRF